MTDPTEPATRPETVAVQDLGDQGPSAPRATSTPHAGPESEPVDVAAPHGEDVAHSEPRAVFMPDARSETEPANVAASPGEDVARMDALDDPSRGMVDIAGGDGADTAAKPPAELVDLDAALARARRATSELGAGGEHEVASDEQIAALTQAHDRLRAALDRVDGGR